MSGAHSLYEPFLRRFRPRRLCLFYRLFDIRRGTRVLDLGGGTFFWRLAIELRLPMPDVTILNLLPAREELPAGVRWIVGDATACAFPDGEFDVIFSNSLIEHVGTRNAQLHLASEIRRLAPRYFVQTPNSRFPIEPHFLAPFVHWLPPNIRCNAIRNFTLWGLLHRPSPVRCRQLVDEIRLLSPADMKELFPEAQLIVERFGGLPKSLIAVRICSCRTGTPPGATQ